MTSIALGPVRKPHLDDSPLSIHSFNKQSLGTHYGPGSMLGTGNSQMTKRGPQEKSRFLRNDWGISGEMGYTHKKKKHPGLASMWPRSIRHILKALTGAHLSALLHLTVPCQTELTPVSTKK